MISNLDQYLEDIRALAGGPGARMSLARLGQSLAQKGINAKTDLDLRLSDLLRQYTSFCQIDGGEVIFLEGPAKRTSGTHRPPTHGLRPDLWRARVFDHPAQTFWLDLQDLTIHAVEHRGDPPDPEQPWRYLQVPPIPTAEQVEFVTSRIPEPVDPAALERMKAAGARWQQAVREQLPAGLARDIREAHREWVVQRTLTWLKEHDIDERRFVRTSRPTSSSTPAVPPATKSGHPVEELRKRLLRCVEQMTLAELSELRVPARFLLDG